jgi:gliding motility-associated-like protein
MNQTLHYILGQKHILFFLFLLGSTNLSAQILTNGDFETGGSGVGFFVHDYTIINPTNGTSTPGSYTRTTDPALMNTSYISGGDHTTGTGNMMVYDASLQSNRFFWTTGNTGGAIGGFTAGTTYIFSFWIKSVSNEVTVVDATRANIGLFFVNANSINPANQSFLAPLPSQGWVNIQYSFVATANNVLLRLKTNNAGPIGNDFAIDDFSITEGNLPFEGSYTSINPTCPTGTDGSITVNLTGGTLPYTTYNLTGTTTLTSNDGVFSGLGEGTYNVTVSDANGLQYMQTGIVLEAPNNLQLSGPVTICPGDTTPLTISGGIGTYTWTANPADPSITDPTSATQNVSPTVTTTYTVTSGTVSSTVNLIENGDFSQGNTLFVTEYTQVANPNPFGVQASYDIVTNPSAWFAAFASCGDHTTGNGNLMVFDGAVDPTGNVIAWSNQNPVAITPNTDYTFSYYLATVATGSPAQMEVTINGISLGNPVTAPGATCLWTLVSYDWNSSSNTTANFAIYDRNSASGGNDFALDDIAFNEKITCLYQKTVTVIVSAATMPTFDAVSPICSGTTLNPLTTTSNNGIAGTWAPALNNTATTTYTFTPTGGQCVSQATLTITVNQPTVPSFTAVAAICAGSALSPLPTTSNNEITGTWFPALNNTATTTYTFTPTVEQCASNTTLTVIVNQDTITPTFTAVAPICAGAVLNILPTTSNNGITGTWSPVLNNTVTTTYTFTPTTGQCASTNTLTITVNQSTTVPTFTAVAPICLGGTLSALPTTSNDGIIGVWSPALNNTVTTTYTFTPAADQCASTTTLTITVNVAPNFAISEGCNGISYTLAAVQDDSSNSQYAWFNSAGTPIGNESSVVIDTSGLYEVVVTQGGCSNQESINVLSSQCLIQKGISPNNDGLNDYFDLEGYNVSQLQIFNRYGAIVYSKVNYENEWYGQSDNGNELPDGTYYYVINFTDSKTKTGWIYNNKEN